MSEYKIDTMQELSLAVADILEKFDKIPDKTNLEQLLTQELTESKAFQSTDEIKETVSEICSTIDLADEQFRSLRESKAKGKSIIVWLKDKISKAIEKLPDTEQNGIIKETKNALKKANSELFSLLYETEMPDELSEPIKNYEFKDINATAIAQNLKKDIENNTFLGAITIGEGFKMELDVKHKEIKAVKDYFKAQIDSPDDKQIKKAVTAAAEIAKKKGFKPLAGKSTSEIALIVDRGVTTAKIAYKIVNGEMTPTDVSDYLIDRTASTISTTIIKTCQKVGSNVGRMVGRAIGSVFSPIGAAIGSVVGKIVGYVAGTAVGGVIAKGVEKIATFAKETVKVAWEGIKSVANSVCEGVKNIGRGIASLFGF